jgi:hypothetical protein
VKASPHTVEHVPALLKSRPASTARELTLRSSLVGSGSAKSLDLLNELCVAVSHLASTVPNGGSNNELAAYSGLPGPEIPDDIEDPWEYVDHKLNRTFGYGKTTEDIALVLRRGPLGMDGLL